MDLKDPVYEDPMFVPVELWVEIQCPLMMAAAMSMPMLRVQRRLRCVPLIITSCGVVPCWEREQKGRSIDTWEEEQTEYTHFLSASALTASIRLRSSYPPLTGAASLSLLSPLPQAFHLEMHGCRSSR